jgi:hypothetical protein
MKTLIAAARPECVPRLLTAPRRLQIGGRMVYSTLHDNSATSLDVFDVNGDVGRALQKSGVFDQLVVGSEASLHLGDRAAS